MKRGPKPFTRKVCPSCGVEKPRSDYYKKADTVSYRCKPCTNVVTRSSKPKYRGRYLAKQNTWRREKYAADPAYRRRLVRQKAARYARLKDGINAARRHRWATDPNDPARRHNRAHDVKRNTPPWAEIKAITAFYWNCPEGYEVDHIIPIKGVIDDRKVSGLHVLSNLQYLPTAQNRKKYNRISEKDIAARIR